MAKKSHDFNHRLLAASRGRYTAVIKLLLERGANPNVQNEVGQTPLSEAVSARNLDGAEIMSPETAALGMSDLLPEGIAISFGAAAGRGFGAGGSVGRGETAGSYGWGGAAGTMAFVDTRRKVRATGMTQYMPSMAYAFQGDFAKWVVADLGA